MKISFGLAGDSLKIDFLKRNGTYPEHFMEHHIHVGININAVKYSK